MTAMFVTSLGSFDGLIVNHTVYPSFVCYILFDIHVYTDTSASRLYQSLKFDSLLGLKVHQVLAGSAMFH